jgi:hypothetical protein
MIELQSLDAMSIDIKAYDCSVASECYGYGQANIT